MVEIESSIGQDFSLMAMFERTLFAARGRQVSPLHARGAYVAFFSRLVFSQLCLSVLPHPKAGQNGAMGMLMLSSGKVLHCKGKQLVPAGQRLVIFTAGGGGYGDPRERTAEELGADVRDSLVSKEAAHAVYCGGTA